MDGEAPVSQGMSDAGLLPYNRRGAALSRLPRRVFFADCTLRDGEQQAGLVMSGATKLKIAHTLAGLGVFEIEAGMPAVSDEDRDSVEAIAGAGLAPKISALARAIPADIDTVASTGCWGVRISFPAGMLQLTHKLRLTPEEYVKKAVAVTAYAKDKGLHVIFSPYDTTRAEEAFLRAAVRALGRTRTVDRLRLVDTTGSATPYAMRYLVGLLREESEGISVEVHTHNDLGLATANAVAAVEAGAEFVSSTINGLGERSGNAATEQVAAALEVLYGVATGIRLNRLTAASQTVSWLTRTHVPPQYPGRRRKRICARVGPCRRRDSERTADRRTVPAGDGGTATAHRDRKEERRGLHPPHPRRVRDDTER